MAVTVNSIVTPQAIGGANTGVTFQNADSTNKKTVYTAGANGSIVTGLSGVTTDTSANNVALWVYDGSTSWQLGCIRVAAASGNDGATNAVNLLNQTAIPALKLDAAGNPILELKASAVLQASVLVAVTSGKTLTLTPTAEDY